MKEGEAKHTFTSTITLRHNESLLIDRKLAITLNGKVDDPQLELSFPPDLKIEGNNYQERTEGNLKVCKLDLDDELQIVIGKYKLVKSPKTDRFVRLTLMSESPTEEIFFNYKPPFEKLIT